jgi:hypothetical protein
MAVFNSYVKLPEGITHHGSMVLVEKCVYMTGVFVDGIHGTPDKKQHR